MRQRSVLEDPAFQTAFLAVSHLVGPRTGDPLGAFATPVTEAVELRRALGSDDRAARTSALARVLERVARRLEERRLA